MPKVDLKKELKPVYTASAKSVGFVNVPRLSFLMIDGYGDPDTEEFQRAIKLLYSGSFALKSHSRKSSPERDWAMMPMEGLWWHDSPEAEWSWTLMIAQPPFVTKTQVKEVLKELSARKGTEDYAKARLESFAEGKCVQVLHVGPYSAEEPTIQRLIEFARANGYELSGKHHEIYVSDPNRVPPERLKTILRYPVKKTGLPAKA
jgi:hypothetical protein